LILINVRVIPSSSRERVVQEENRLKLYVSAPAESGRANKALIELLSGYLKKRKTDITIIRGARSRNKVVRVD